ncbi:MAG: Txe/YoeB family addiction module toxin [Bacteroidetes bacterium]|jgi:toxin YoeB|nr:Txe/YoeB family addiction module toxin [Bacteroidota bacterium]MBT6685897.1 Txe/YoeB family addiction module toxin [Bacteroidota bacterium]MBT7144039.1 Txe/YoeB family addiction module toxin [Bacteroidota bacterium]MBT7490961.1 Txe/YoeB family addiction module toxin [Bacteroidota bacterium]
MEIEYTPQSKEDLHFGKKSNKIAVLKKIRILLEVIVQNPYEGIGKPEALKFNLTGCWSRRINKEHRIVYEVFDDRIIVHSLRGHY